MIIWPAKLDITLNKLIQDTGHVLAAVKRINTYLRTGQDNFVKVT